MKKNLYSFLILAIFLVQPLFAQIDYGDFQNPVFSYNFEGAYPNVILYHQDSTNLWQVGTPVKTEFNVAHSIPYALMTDTAQTVPVNNHSYFDLLLWTPFDYLNPLVSFYHKWDVDSLTEGCWIDISFDNGASWKNIINDTAMMVYNWPYINSENLYSANDTLMDGTPAYTGNSGGWVFTQFQWIWFIPAKDKDNPNMDTVRLRFHMISDSVDNGREGWMIDDLSITDIGFYGAINENPFQQTLQLFPNPVRDELFLSVEGEKIVSVKVYSLDGRCITSLEKQEAIDYLSLDGLHSGIYILEATTAGGKQARNRFVVTNSR